MTEAALRDYARLLLQVGLHLVPGQKVQVTFRPEQRRFVAILSEEAYTLGATYVAPRPVFDDLTRSRALAAAPETLDFVPSFTEAQDRELVDDEWSVLSLVGKEDPEVFAGLEGGRVSRIEAALQAKRKYYRDAVMADRLCWCVAAVPTDGWARQVLGARATADDLWSVFAPIYALDRPDPNAFWTAKLAGLDRRANTLTDLGLDSVRFTGPGTDLTVGLLPGSSWVGGGASRPNGDRYAPNLPTEEVFNTPDWRRTEGTVTVTRPVEVQGVEVEGVTFTFREGRVVAYAASRGQDVLAEFLARDAQANALGEVALVDGSSAIFQSGKVFHNILFDENAASHIALGAGYTSNVEGAEALDEAGRLARGCNVSQVHVDFMIGSPELTVTARTRDGRTLTLIERGRFQL